MSNIYEVAKRVGVSTATVSRVLSQPNVVAPATRRKVLEAIERLGYEPNSTAQNLRALRTGKILVTVPDISNPFFSLIRFSVGTGFQVIAAHQRRHLWQAERVRERAGFPQSLRKP